MNKKQQLALEQQLADERQQLAKEKQQLANEKQRLALEELKSLQMDFAAVASNGIKWLYDVRGVSTARDDYSTIGLYIKNIEVSGFTPGTVTALSQMKASFDSAAAFHYKMSQDWAEKWLGSLSPEKKAAERYSGYAQKVAKVLNLL
jgi:hypothetical protein